MRKLWRWLLVPTAILSLAGGLYLGYRALVGWPATPMTSAEAEQLFSQCAKPGESIDEAKRWLASQGIQEDHPFAGTVSYHVVRGPGGTPRTLQ